MRRLRVLTGSIGIWVVSAGSAASASSNALVFLQETGAPGLDDGALAEAVKIYTRDLGIELEQRVGAPREATSESLGALVTMVRSSGIRGVFWYRILPETPSEAVLYAITSSDGHQAVNALRVGGVGTPGFYRVMALKLRAVLTGAAALEVQEPTPPPAPAPPPAPPPTPATKAPPPPTARAPAPPTATAPLAAPAYRARLLISVDYLLTVPVDTSLLRHGIGVEAAVPFARRWQAHLSIDVSSQPSRAVASGVATLADVPVRLGLRVLVSRGRLSLGASALVGLHILSVSGLGSDGTRGSALNVAAGVGALLVGRLRFSQHVAADMRFSAEEVLPDLHFLLHGTPAIAAGGPLFVLGAGLELAAP